MRHFIAYHNPERMGYQYSVPKNGQERILTNKRVQHVVGNMVWVVTFKNKYDFMVASVFLVTDAHNVNEKGFKHEVSGRGHAFRPWREIKGLDWFQRLMEVTGHFGFGLQEVTDRSVIAGLCQIAAQDGYILTS